VLKPSEKLKAKFLFIYIRIISSPPCPQWLWGPPASYPMGTRGSFPGGKVARA